MLRMVRLLTSFLLMVVTVSYADNVYLSYTDTDLGPGGSKGMMMRLDEKGNILQGPTVVLLPAVCGLECLSTLSNDGAGRFVLVSGTQKVLGPSVPYKRTLVNKQTFAATKTRSLGISITANTFPGSMQATQNSSPRFVVLETSTDNAWAFGVTDKGTLDGTQWRVDPRISGRNNFQVGVAPDGRLAWAVNVNGSNPPWKIYSQGLNDQGRPNIDPSVSIGSDAYLVGSVDVSNPLANNRRLLVYTESSPTFTATVKSLLIDATTGAKVGAPKTIAEGSTFGFVQNLAVDPKGRFLFYTQINTHCNKELVYYVPLNSAGEPSGNPKTIVGCDDLKAIGASVLDVFVE